MQVEGRREFAKVPVEARGLCVAEGEAEGRRARVWGDCGLGQLPVCPCQGQTGAGLPGLCSFLFSSCNHLLFDLLPAFTRHISTCQGIPEFPLMWPWCAALQGPGSVIILLVPDGIQCYLNSQDYPAR